MAGATEPPARAAVGSSVATAASALTSTGPAGGPPAELGVVGPPPSPPGPVGGVPPVPPAGSDPPAPVGRLPAGVSTDCGPSCGCVSAGISVAGEPGETGAGARYRIRRGLGQ